MIILVMSSCETCSNDLFSTKHCEYHGDLTILGQPKVFLLLLNPDSCNSPMFQQAL